MMKKVLRAPFLILICFCFVFSLAQADACGITPEQAKHGVMVRVEKGGQVWKETAEFVVPNGYAGYLINCVDSKFVPNPGSSGPMQFGLNYDYGTGKYSGQIYYRYVQGNKDGPKDYHSIYLRPGKYRLEIAPNAGPMSWAEMVVIWH